MTARREIGVIACGAIARELFLVIRENQWHHLKLHCLPAKLHNQPEQIPTQVLDKIHQLRGRYSQLFVAYADCGTGGQLDTVLNEFNIPRLPGAHCYEFFSGRKIFQQFMDEEPGTLFLTDFLVKHFQRLIICGLGLDRYPQLRDIYFGNYQRLLYISQTDSLNLQQQARDCAEQIGLNYAHCHTGFQPLQQSIQFAEASSWQN